MADVDTACMTLYRKVRDFALTTKDWETAIRYFTKPDEERDLTLVSKRVYGTRSQALVIQAAAGLDSPEYKLKQQRLVLPTVDALRAMREAAGFEEPDIV